MQIKLMGLALLLLTVTGCVGTKITSSWTAPAAQVNTASVKKIVVVGLFSDKDRQIREHMEAHLVGDLIEMGYQAVSSLQEFGPKSFQQNTEAAVMEKLRNANTDAIITISLLDKSKEEAYTPAGAGLLIPYATRYNNFMDYYNTYYNRIYNPGYYTSSTKYLFETSLYLPNQSSAGKLIFSAQSEAFDPDTIDQMAHSYGKTIAKEMKRKGIVQQRK